MNAVKTCKPDATHEERANLIVSNILITVITKST